MRRIGSIVALILSVVLAVGVAVDTTAQDKNVIRKLMVPGNEPWTPTGVLVGPGDAILVQAAGKVFFSNGEPHSGVGPAGYMGDYEQDFPVDATLLGMGPEEGYGDPIPGENHAALIMRIGGELIAVGAGGEFSGHEGEIELGINDCSFVGECYNTGAFTVTLTIKRGKRIEEK